MANIAIIGAGMAGSTVAHELSSHVSKITVFEKSRGVGGRMATRRIAPFAFDHGAQFFTSQSEAFGELLLNSKANSQFANWETSHAIYKKTQLLKIESWGPSNHHYVCLPHMNSLIKYLLSTVAVHCNQQIVEILRKNEQWAIYNQEKELLGLFDYIVITAPAPQTVKLIPKNASFYNDIKNISMESCIALMLGFNDKLHCNHGATSLTNNDISWLAANHTKPGRTQNNAYIVHASHAWSKKWLNYTSVEEADLLSHLKSKVKQILSKQWPTIQYEALHRWKYAMPTHNYEQPQVFEDKNLKLAVSGDWCYHGRVEGAYLSGIATANQIKKTLNIG